MNTESLKLIRDVIINSGRLALVEIAQDSIYLHFQDVELGEPKYGTPMSLSVRFGDDSFFTAFFNDIWDIQFLSKYNFKKQFLSEELFLDVKDIRFLDFEYLNKVFYNYKHQKTITTVDDFNIHNINCDFFMMVELEKMALVVGANQMDFFTSHERLDDNSLKELSNEWILYFLNYHLKRNIIKDPMCENHPLIYKK